MSGTRRKHWRAFSYAGLTVRAEASDLSDVRWLAQFLGPSFRVTKATNRDWTVELSRAPRRWHSLNKNRPNSSKGRRDAFYLDTRIDHLRRWSRDAGQETYFDTASACFFVVDRERRRTQVVTRRRHLSVRLAFMKVLREYAMSHVIASPGLLPVHASSFVVDGRAVLIAGHKRAGKTSLLIHALHGPQCRYLANDRTVLSVDRSGAPWARGFPTIVNLRASGLAHFPHIGRALQASGYYPSLTRGESRSKRLGLATPWRPEQHTLSPDQLTQLLDVPTSAKARLGAFLFPRVTGGNGRIRFRRLPPAEAADRLREYVFRSGFDRKSGSLFSIDGKPRGLRPTELASQTETILQGAPAYECAMGSKAYEDDRWWSDLLKRLA